MFIKEQEMRLKVTGLELNYWGYADKLTGILVGSHSNQNETRVYTFDVDWKKNPAGDLQLGVWTASENIDHLFKGLGSFRRLDVQKEALKKAYLWRNIKLKEQSVLWSHFNDSTAVSISVKKNSTIIEARWIKGAVLLEPAPIFNCRAGWLEVLPIGNAGLDAAHFVAHRFFNGGRETIICEAFQRGLSIAEVEEVLEAGSQTSTLLSSKVETAKIEEILLRPRHAKSPTQSA